MRKSATILFILLFLSTLINSNPNRNVNNSYFDLESNNKKEIIESEVNPTGNGFILHHSQKYGYAISIPDNFKLGISQRPHIDTKYLDVNGSTILVNVSPRAKEEYNFTAHSYTKEMLQQMYRQNSPNLTVTYSEKLIVAGEKAFLIESENGNPGLKAMECTFFHKDIVVIITCTCEVLRFNNYRQAFKYTINSMKFN